MEEAGVRGTLGRCLGVVEVGTSPEIVRQRKCLLEVYGEEIVLGIYGKALC